MTYAFALSAIGLAVLLSWVLTRAARSYALRCHMVDIPNQRSSHTTPRPRGLGIGFVLTLLAWTVASLWLFPNWLHLWAALLGGGLLVSAVGWLDDRKRLSSTVRLLFYGLAAAWAVSWLGGLPAVNLGVAKLHLGIFGAAVAWAWIFCFTNVYNFMDGIDGLAAGEGLAVSAAAGALLFLHGDRELAILCWVLSAALGGFIPWNWPPAKVFMGDVGSNFLGFVFASLAVASENRDSLPIMVWGVLLLVFLVDGASTFFLRLLKGERVSQAHRSHAYQRAVESGFSHAQVTGAILVLDGALVALAFVAQWRRCLSLPILFSSTGLLFLVWLRFAHRTTRMGGSPKSGGS
jgi:Fuc2NAc and GlcNAc transferase